MSQQRVTSYDPVDDAIEAVLKAARVVLLVVVLLPLVLPAIAARFFGVMAATRARFWIGRSWLTPAAVCGAGVVVALLTVETALAVHWFRHTPIGRGGLLALLPPFVDEATPFLVANLCAGLLLLPAMFLLQRRRIAALVQGRRLGEVMLQERIETARTRAAAWTASRRMGVSVDVRTGQITGGNGSMTAPFPVGGRWAFGLVATPTVRAFRERFGDQRRVRDWVEPSGAAVVLPANSSAARALVVAESGTGKTVLLNGLVSCALAAGWPVFVIDAKGDPADANDLVEQARAAGRSAAVGARWNLFSGTGEQITEKLMRLLPPADGANQHYLDEARGVLGMIQSHSPIRSVADLRERLGHPAPHLRDDGDLAAVEAVVEPRSGLTAAGRVLQALTPALRPLEEWLDVAGWSYAHPNADVTVMSLSPVDVTQARLGHLLMVDLRHFLASRLKAGDKSPVLVVVDEFPQLVTTESDPGDAAAALLETARSSGAGLILAAQSTAGLSNDEGRRARALASGAALIVGRSKDPHLIVGFAGSVTRFEANTIAGSDALGSGRPQNTYVIPPQDVREAWDGSFWLIQGGAVAPFRTMPPRRPALTEHTASLLVPEPELPKPEPDQAAVIPAPRPMTRKTPPPRFATSRFEQAAAPSPAALLTDMPSEKVVGFEISIGVTRGLGWEAVFYATTDKLVLDDLEPDRAPIPAGQRIEEVGAGWAADWRPGMAAPWKDGSHFVPNWRRRPSSSMSSCRPRAVNRSRALTIACCTSTGGTGMRKREYVPIHWRAWSCGE